MIVGDGPAVAVSGDGRDVPHPLSARRRIIWRFTEHPQPRIATLNGQLGQFPRPALHRLVPFDKGSGHVCVADTGRPGDEPGYEVRAASPLRPGGVCPTLHAAVQDRGWILGAGERPGCHELGEALFHVETA